MPTATPQQQTFYPKTSPSTKMTRAVAHIQTTMQTGAPHHPTMPQPDFPHNYPQVDQ